MATWNSCCYSCTTDDVFNAGDGVWIDDVIIGARHADPRIGDPRAGESYVVFGKESTEAVDTYRRSFILGAMNRRAEPDSISETVVPRTLLEDYVGGRIE